MSSPLDLNPPLPAVRLSKALAQHPSSNSQAIDYAHAHLVAGLILAHKPEAVLELGVGSAYLTRVVLEALRENRHGCLTSVDNFFDWQGIKPIHIEELQRAYPEWNLIISDELSFLQSAAPHTYMFIISDGDHTRGYQTASGVFQLAVPGALLVFHDTSSDLFRLLARLPSRCRRLGFPAFHFTAKSLPDELTDRGLLVVSKPDRRRFSMDYAARLYLLWRDRLRPLWRRATIKS
jgi:spermidine synthase